jgi:hypothetical protein
MTNFILRGIKVENNRRKAWKLRSKLHGILTGSIEKVELSILEKSKKKEPCAYSRPRITPSYVGGGSLRSM